MHQFDFRAAAEMFQLFRSVAMDRKMRVGVRFGPVGEARQAKCANLNAG